jgi:hypothetical protein
MTRIVLRVAARRAFAVTASLHKNLHIQFCISENSAYFDRNLARTFRLEFEVVNLDEAKQGIRKGVRQGLP